MIERSEVTGKKYSSEECVFFRNIQQVAFYILHNCPVQDIFTDNDMKLVFVFKKDDHKKVLPLWMENKEKQVDGDK